MAYIPTYSEEAPDRAEVDALNGAVLIEFGDTEQMFFKPQRKETEDYITGRFG